MSIWRSITIRQRFSNVKFRMSSDNVVHGAIVNGKTAFLGGLRVISAVSA